jgi:hypothetical protein
MGIIVESVTEINSTLNLLFMLYYAYETHTEHIPNTAYCKRVVSMLAQKVSLICSH